MNISTLQSLIKQSSIPFFAPASLRKVDRADKEIAKEIEKARLQRFYDGM